jgi:hypothetical protein
MYLFRHLHVNLCSYKSFAIDAVRLFAAQPGYGSPEPLRQAGVDDRSVNPGGGRVGTGPILRKGENDKAPAMYRPAS